MQLADFDVSALFRDVKQPEGRKRIGRKTCLSNRKRVNFRRLYVLHNCDRRRIGCTLDMDVGDGAVDIGPQLAFKDQNLHTNLNDNAQVKSRHQLPPSFNVLNPSDRSRYHRHRRDHLNFRRTAGL
jgi:hypothetical protein